MKMNKPFSEACEQNRDPILAVLTRVFKAQTQVLEIGSGTGQHAAYFPRSLSHLSWLPSDIEAHLPGIEAWRLDSGLINVHPAHRLDVDQPDWKLPHPVDAVFSANTTHIMSWASVLNLLRGIGEVLPSQRGIFCLYGPFNYQGHFTSDSNARFDQFLRQRDPASGIRDMAALIPAAEAHGLHLQEDVEMPVNNRCLVFGKLG